MSWRLLVALVALSASCGGATSSSFNADATEGSICESLADCPEGWGCYAPCPCPETSAPKRCYEAGRIFRCPKCAPVAGD